MDAFEVTYSPIPQQTDAFENITFPKLRLQAVKTVPEIGTNVNGISPWYVSTVQKTQVYRNL